MPRLACGIAPAKSLTGDALSGIRALVALKRIERVKLYPSPAQVGIYSLDVCRQLYNILQSPGTNVAAKAALNRKILDAGWRQFTTMLVDKGEETGRTVVFVKAQFSSQTCIECGHVAAANRPTQATFKCVKCEHADHADTNAAKVILNRAELRPAGSGAEVSDCEDPRSARTRARTPVTQAIE